MNKDILLNNIDKIHTTELGLLRIKNNIGLIDKDPLSYCINLIKNKNCKIYKDGKNWYCEINNIRITVNSYSYTIITAHLMR